MWLIRNPKRCLCHPSFFLHREVWGIPSFPPAQLHQTPSISALCGLYSPLLLSLFVQSKEMPGFVVMILLGIGAEGGFLQARPSWHLHRVLTDQVFYLFSFYDLSPPSGMSASWTRGSCLFGFLWYIQCQAYRRCPTHLC